MTPDVHDVLSTISPSPAFLRIDGPSIAVRDPSIGRSADGESKPRLGDLEPDGLAPGGYALRVADVDGRGEVFIDAPDDAGFRNAAATLAMLNTATPGQLPQLSIRDEPALPWRGTIEGFYGAPWSHEARLEHLRFCAANKLNNYAYAPKDDPYHREKWRELYPAGELARLAELVSEAVRLGVTFTYTLAPGLSMTFSSTKERELLFAKAEQLWGIGLRSFALLFDDIPPTLQQQADIDEYGADERASGYAHGIVCAEFQDRFLMPRGGERLVMVPMNYAGGESTPYRRGLAESLPKDTLVWWTGADIVVGEVTRADIDAAAASFERDLLLWDNFPVNDFDFGRLFLGPLLGRTTDLTGSRLVGVNANPMIHPTASQLGLVTVADWAWNPRDYSPAFSARRALGVVAGSLAPLIQPLVAVTSAWPPSADRSPEFTAATAAALSGDDGAYERLDQALSSLVSLPRTLADADDELVREVRPWLDAAATEARIAQAATEILASGRVASAEEKSRIRGDFDALDALSKGEPNVLRTLLGDYTRAVLDRT